MALMTRSCAVPAVWDDMAAIESFLAEPVIRMTVEILGIPFA